MIQLYIPSNKNFEFNGDITLEATLCEASFNLNGNWGLELEVPIEYIDYVIKEAVVKVKTPYGNQLYRIYSTEKDDYSIYAWANPIFLDAKNDCFLWDMRLVEKSGQEALDGLFDGTKYSGKSDITKVNTLYIQQKNAIAAINGDDDNTFINRWGGEIAYNNFEISINERLGADNGTRAEFGYNLASIKENVDMSNVVTRIIPKAYNGILLPNQETIDSTNIDKFAVVYTKVIEYSDIKLAADAFDGDAEAGCTICNTLEDVYVALRNRAKDDFAKGIDLPTIAYEVDIVDLSNCDDYKDIKTLVALQLGDDVYCYNKRLKIETKARVISMVYDCCNQKTKELTIGDYEPTVFDATSDIAHRIEQVINKTNNTIMADKVNGVLNMLYTQLRYQKDLAQRSDVRAILFEDINPESTMYGAMSIGTQGIQITKTRNETNTDWNWTNSTAIDFHTIYANHILTGVLSDKLGNFYLDMDKGILKMNDGEFSGQIIGSSFIATKTSQYTYTTSDIDAMADLFLYEKDPTQEQLARYDLNQNGRVDSNDALIIQKLLQGKYGNTNGIATFTDIISINLDKSGKLILERKLNGTTITRTEYNSGSINKIGGNIMIDGEPVITEISGTIARFG